jgi:hypothetical protein
MNNIKSSNKSFGIVFSCFFAILVILNFIKFEQIQWNYALVSLLLLISAFFYSKIFTPFNYIWLKFGNLLSRFISPIIMLILYFTIIFFTSLYLRILRKDILDLKIDKNSKTFWKIKDTKNGNMNKQF